MNEEPSWLMRGHARVRGLVAGCGGDDDAVERAAAVATERSGGDAGKVAVLLPDSKSSVRWETVDRPFLKKAFEDAGVEATIENAEGDKSTQQQQAEQAITNGAKVILLVNLDSGSGAAIEAQAAAAGRQGHRLRPPDARLAERQTTTSRSTTRRSASCRARASSTAWATRHGAQVAVLNGSPTDNNATLFKNGYDSVINPKFDSGDWKEIDDQSVPDWDNQKALTIFEQILQKNNNKVDGVLAANDGLANAAISALKQRKLPQVPVTGQDATLQGVQNIVNGDQCMTVYKAIKKEADAASKLAISLAKGEEPRAPTTRSTTRTRTSRPFCSTRSPSRRTTSRTTPARWTSRRWKTSAPARSPPSARSLACSSVRTRGARGGRPGALFLFAGRGGN